MKKTIASKSFSVLVAALLMVGAVGCSTAPVNEEPATESAAVSTEAETSTNQVEDITAQAPMTEEPVLQDSVSASSTSMDPLSAPSSLGASSSGRGH